MFLCTRGHRNLIIFPAVLQTQALHFHLRSLWRGVGCGWDSSCSCAHAGTATLSSFLLSCRHRHCTFIFVCSGEGWGGGGTVHVPVHTRAPQPYHLSCCRADTGTSLSSSFAVERGGVRVGQFMFLCTRGHRNLIIFPAVVQTHALHFHLRSL